MDSPTQTEKITTIILFFTIVLWVTAPYIHLNPSAIALTGAALYFITGIIDWKDAQECMDWGLIIFFGGALSFGAAI